MTKSEKEKLNPNALTVNKKGDESDEKALARTFLNPTTNAAQSIKSHHDKQDMLTVDELRKELEKLVSEANKGNLHRPEAILLAQAHTLDSLFTDLLGRSRNNMGEYLPAAIKYMQLALKAQTQCRTTLQTLADIKNPKPYIQNNKAQYQQINNTASIEDKSFETNTRAHAHARKNLKSSNGLLEDKRNETQWLDTGAPETTSRNDTELEAMGAKHWTED